MAEFRLTPPNDPNAMGSLYGVPQDAMWMQSGMMQAPPRGVRPTVPIDLQQSEPGAAAAYRMQQAVRPDFGRPGNGPSVASILAATPLGLVDPIARLGAEYGPEIATGGVYAPMRGDASVVGSAQGAEFKEPEPKRPAEIQSQIDKINKDISPAQTKLDRLKARFEAKQIDKDYYNGQRVPLESQIERSKGQIKEIDAPFQRQLTDWETRRSSALTAETKSDMDRRAKEADAELPFRVKHPDATKAIVGAGNILTGGTALATGLLSRGRLKPILGATGVGALEGAITENVPEWLDLSGFQPVGGPAWQKTLEQQKSMNNLVKTGAAAGVHAGEAFGIGYGSSFGPKIAERLGEYGSKIKGAFSRAPAGSDMPASLPPSMEVPSPGPIGGSPMQLPPSMPPTPPNMQGMPGMMSAPSTLPVTEPLPPPGRARAPRSAPRLPLPVEPVLTPSGWQDPITGKLIAPPPMSR